MQEKSDLEQVRREKLSALQQRGINPYPAPTYEVTHTVAAIREKYEKTDPTAENNEPISIAGRIMSMRDMGKASFAQIQDHTGKIQIYIKRDDCFNAEKNEAPLYDEVFSKLLDIGDIIGVKGRAFRTRVGELSLRVAHFTLLAKSLRPLPIVKEKEGERFDEVSDPEFRYRQRYVDLIIHSSIKKVFTQRTAIFNTIRSFYNDMGYLEVETPILQNIPGGANARPFITHHNALDMPLYLRIANELYLKRLIIGGFNGVYEFAKDFRNEGMDRMHNPEFTVMELYVAYKDYLWMMDITEKLLEHLALTLHGTTRLPAGDKEIDFKASYPRLPFYEAIRRYAGIDAATMDAAALQHYCMQEKITLRPQASLAQIMDAIFSAKCEHHLIQPTFIIDHPLAMSPLTKSHRSKAGVVERFELYINGREIANAYSELNDPIDQLQRFQEQARHKEQGDEEAMFIDYDFIRALNYGMPPTAGIGIGMDRLVMLLTNQPSIQDVLFFPQMRPERDL